VSIPILNVTSAAGDSGALVFVPDPGGDTMTTEISSRRLADHRLLTESLGHVAAVAEDLVADFYRQLSADYPEMRRTFPALFPADLQPQREKLLGAMVTLVTNYDRPAQLMPLLTTLGREHVGYGVELSHYAAAGATLMSVLRRFVGDAWNDEYEGAWQRAYTFVAGAMIMASVELADAEVPDLRAA
jgi:hemoglobin-like flavoprotein